MMMLSKNYDMSAMRKEYIILASASLKKSSKFYAEDYENICRAANRMTRRELIDAISRQNAIISVSKGEIARNCQF